MELSERQKSLLFWASFVSLAAAGVGFALRVMTMGEWGVEFGLTEEEKGAIFGLSLWPIAVTMILFSLIIDRVGYRVSMFLACGLQLGSVVLTVLANDVGMLKWGCFLGGLGHGIIEACINPLCAAMYTTTKSKMLNILHASWPGGIVAGGITYILIGDVFGPWQNTFWIILPPVIAYGLVFARIHDYPVDERVAANVSNREMLREFGGLGAFLAITFVVYELTSQLLGLTGADGGWIAENKLTFSAILGVVGGAAFGMAVGSLGKWLFFFLCLIMIPLAATELGTDAWIKELMKPVLGKEGASWAIVASAGIMMVLRFFAGVPLRFMSPPALLLFSSLFSMTGLYLLSGSTGALVILAFVIYAIGQTFYWGTMLGLVSERFPKGGAMTLNTVSAIGLLTVGVFGGPFLGAVTDSHNSRTVTEYAAAVEGFEAEDHVQRKQFFFVEHDAVIVKEVKEDPALNEAQVEELAIKLGENGRLTLKAAAGMPASMAIAFLLILLWFRSKGGYRPVELTEH